MYRIIRINQDVVRIGLEDGRYFEVSSSKLDFAPEVGDEVDVYFNNGETLVVLKKKNSAQLEKKSVETIPVATPTVLNGGYSVERKSIIPVFICVLAALVLIAGGIFFYVNNQNKKASEYANEVLSSYKKLQDSYFQKRHSAGDLVDIGFQYPESDDFKITADESFFTLTSQRKMRGCPQGTTWTMTNSVSQDEWETKTSYGSRIHLKWTLHHTCSMVVKSDAEHAEEDKKNCEWFVPEFKSICK